MIDIKDSEYPGDSLDGDNDGLGGLLSSAYYYAPSSATQIIPESVTAQTSGPGESLQNMIGLSDLVYSSQDPTHSLPQIGAVIKVNDAPYLVIDVEDDPSGYEGMAVLDEASNSLIVVNRGTQTSADFGQMRGWRSPRLTISGVPIW